MMKFNKIKIKSRFVHYFEIDGFIFDVELLKDDFDNDIYEAWIYHGRYGFKSFCFGCLCNDVSFDKFIEMVIYNSKQYIDAYKDEFFDEEDKENV